ncbi:hypothetical protein E1264_38655 [Actinomadura sp. KC216]|uniref:hypothetical protein n=1 Tax=Actinomadura sp. KC216 TaxID=2530370 RepID=UPI00104D19FE|nr:hypothetical protein [Actinomadura sp. KC216]TDB76376.1 hypothetical protein E1264_38655 [Actinomadura sp. KC216]
MEAHDGIEWSLIGESELQRLGAIPILVSVSTCGTGQTEPFLELLNSDGGSVADFGLRLWDDKTGTWNPVEDYAPAAANNSRSRRSLCYASRFIPTCERADWLEEQQAYLLDLPTRWSRARWLISAILGLPRLVLVIRSELRKESA